MSIYESESVNGRSGVLGIEVKQGCKVEWMPARRSFNASGIE